MINTKTLNPDAIVLSLRLLAIDLQRHAEVANGAALLIDSLRGDVVRAHALVEAIGRHAPPEDTGHRPPFQLYRIKEVIAMTGLSRASIYLQMKAGTFPQSIKTGESSVAWDEADLLAWLALNRPKGEGQ